MFTRHQRSAFTAASVLLLLSGCHNSRSDFEPYGKTFYLDGAGGLGFGTSAVPEGLRRAGYLGDCEVFDWSTTKNPLLDQVDPLGFNKMHAKTLAHKIRAYRQKFPKQEVNVIALSAGTGVTVWALERLNGKYRVNNVFLLGSSLASSYDMRLALKSVKGEVYVYHSPHDAILAVVPMIGTVDGKLGAKVAGLVGLRGRPTRSNKIVNIGWEKKWERLGWNGGHTDCIGRTFVQYEIARKLMGLAQPPEEILPDEVATETAGVGGAPAGEAK